LLGWEVGPRKPTSLSLQTKAIPIQIETIIPKLNNKTKRIMASKKDKKVEEKTKKAMTPEEKAAKRKARQEALKNRPEGQRPNGKQIDVIEIGEGKEIRKYATPVKAHGRSIGCMITTVALEDGSVTAVAESFVPGEIVPKVKKGHGTLTSQKAPKEKKEKKEKKSKKEAED